MGSAVLDTAVGMAFAFFALSLVCSGVMEWIANLLNKRAAFLLRGLRQLLDGELDKRLERQSLIRDVLGRPGADPAMANTTVTEAARGGTAPIPVPAGGLATALLGHPLIRSHQRPSWWRPARAHNPSYLPAATVSRALLDMLLPESRSGSTAELTSTVGRLPEGMPGREALLALARDAGSDLDRLRANIEQWYDEQMRQVSGWYKRWTKKWLLALGLVVAIMANADALAMGHALYRDEPLRTAVVAQAVSAEACPAAGTGDDAARQRCLEQQRDTLRELQLPFGWSAANRPGDWEGWLLKILGWLLTAAAAAIGAPFWFDALGRLGSWRNAGPRPAEST